MSAKLTKKNAGFTLVELLVVVAIIAVIGAGVAVTYQRLDDKAKTAVEMSDIATLKKVVKHWGAINDYKIPNEMDSLIDSDGNLYSQMEDTSGVFSGYTDGSTSGMGLLGPAGFTFMVHPAPARVLSNLAACGMTLTYTHLTSGVKIANDSTFTIGNFEGDVDTSETLTTLLAGDAAARTIAADLVAVDASAETYPFTAPDGNTYATQGDLVSAQATAQSILDAKTTDLLAFIYPGGGAQMSVSAGPMGTITGSAPMNMTDEIISNAGLRPDEVASPLDTGTTLDSKRYYLVAMGFGRFSSIYQGKAIRADAPATGKRQAKSNGTYSRYLGIFRVPVAAYDSMIGNGQPVELVDVLSPQGYSVAALSDNYIADEMKVKD